MRVSNLTIGLLTLGACQLAVGTDDLQLQRTDGSACAKDVECEGSCSRGICCGVGTACETLALSWWKAFEGQAHLASVSVASDGSVAMVGDFSGVLSFSGELEGVGGRDGFVAALNADGSPRWAKSYGGPADDTFRALAHVDDELLVAGTAGGALAFPLCGEPSVALGAPDQQRLMVARLRDGGCADFAVEAGQSGAVDASGVGTVGEAVFVAGVFDGVLSEGMAPAMDGFDSFVAELAPFSGAQQGTVQLTGEGNQRVTSMATEGLDVVLAGELDDELRLSGLPTLKTSGGMDAFVVRIGAGQVPMWGAVIGGTGEQNVSSVAVAQNAVYLAGCFTGTLQLDQQVVARGTDAYVVKVVDGDRVGGFLLTSDASVGCPHVALDDGGRLVVATTFGGSMTAGGDPFTAENEGIRIGVLDDGLELVADVVVAARGAVHVTSMDVASERLIVGADVDGDLQLDDQVLAVDSPSVAVLSFVR